MKTNSLFKKVVSVAVSVAIVGMSVPIIATSGENSVQTQAEPNRVAVVNNAVGDTFTVDNIKYTTYADKTGECYVSGSNLSAPTNVTIPATVNGYNVTGIGDDAFVTNSNLTGISIPNSVISIGARAFRSCTGLTSISIPASVTSIGENAFGNCSNLATLTVDGDNQSYKAVDNVLFSKDGTLLHTYPMNKADTTYTIPDGVTSIGAYAFFLCSNLTSITIPNSVTSIETYAFSSCTGLTSITIPAGVTSIGDRVFLACSNLATINVNETNQNYKSVDGVLFGTDRSDNPILLHTYPTAKPDTDYTIPDSVETIGSYAFYGCTYLTSVTIPDSVTSIGEGAFQLFTKLASVTIGSGVTSIGDRAFSNCTGLQGTPTEQGSIGPLIIPDSVTSIGENAFNRCQQLTGVTIGSGVTSIGKSAFQACNGLTSITIPDSVTSIGYYAFSNCTGLASVTIGSGITSIGGSAFIGCSNLKYVLFATDNTGTWGTDVFNSTPLKTSTGYFHSSQTVITDLVSQSVIASGNGVPITGFTPPTVVPSNVTAQIKTSSKATFSDNVSVQVSWEDDETVSGYRVQRSTDGGTTWKNVGDATTKSIDDTVASDDIGNATYKVAAFNQATIAGGDATDPFNNKTVAAVGDYSDSVGISYNITYTYENTQGTVTDNTTSAKAGGKAEFTVTPQAGYKIKEVTSDIEGLTITDEGNGKYSFTMPDNPPVSGVNISITFEGIYSVSIPELEGGSVTASPNQNVAPGATVTLTVKPEAGYQLQANSLTVKTDKEVNVTVTAGSGGTYTFAMPTSTDITSKVNVDAKFDAIAYDVKIDKDITNGEVKSDKDTANVGNTVKLTVTPEDGYQLQADSLKVVPGGGGESITPQPTGNPNEYSFTMPADNVTVTAKFDAIAYDVKIDTAITNGKVKSNKETANAGDTVTLTVAPDAGYQLKDKSLTVTTASDPETPLDLTDIGNNQYTFKMPADNVNVTAVFEEATYNVVAVNDATKGTIDPCPESVQYGSTAKVTLKAADGYEAKGVNYATSQDGPWETTNATYNSDTNEWEFDVPALTAGSTLYLQGVFEGKPHDVIIPSDTTVNGTVKVVPAPEEGNLLKADGDTYNTGDRYQVIATPNEGYELKSLTVTGDDSGDPITLDENNIFTMPNENITVTADFEAISPSPTPTPTPTPTPDDGGGTGGGGTGTGGNGTSGANATGTSYSSGSAKTGDSTAVGVVGLTALAGLGVAVMLRRRRK